MGTVLQKRKRRSGAVKVRQNPKSKKQHFGNAYIASQWNDKETLAQNYRRLGLSSKLGRATGGTEHGVKRSTAFSVSQAPGTRTRKAQNQAQSVEATTEVRIERDPQTGAIVRVIEPEASPATHELDTRTTAEQTAAARFKPLSEPGTAEDEEDEWQGFTDPHAADGHVGAAVLGDGTTTQALSELSRAASVKVQKVKRKQSERERDWCRRLVQRHGTHDFAAMARDAKLNVMQQSQGDVRRRVTLYLSEL